MFTAIDYVATFYKVSPLVKGEKNFIISENWPSSNNFYAEVNDFGETGLSLGTIKDSYYACHPEFKSCSIDAFNRHNSHKVQPIHDLCWPHNVPLTEV